MLGKTHPIQVQLDGLLDDLLGLKVTVPRVFSVAMEINSHGKGLSHPSKNVKTSRQDRASEMYGNQAQWTRIAILNVAWRGKFSSDRDTRECCRDIWKVEGIKEQTRKWAGLGQDNLLTITESSSPCG